MVATPFGPNHAMNALAAVSTWRAPASATNTATGRATSSVKATIATAAQPSPNRVSSVKMAPKTRNTPSLTTSRTSSERSSKASRMSGRQMPKAIAAHEHGDEAVALGRQHGGPVGGERHADRVQRLLMGHRAARHQPRGHPRDQTRP